MTRVEVLMATYNAATYIEEQLDSILAQTHDELDILVRDNCSTDATREILAAYSASHPGRLRVIASDTNVGASQNFGRLLDAASGEYLMFADADDVWLPQKVARTLAAMQRAEARHGREAPLLVHTDLRVVDEALNEVAASFWRYQALDVRRGRSLNRLLLSNVVTGNTAMVNRALAELGRPVPPAAIMHDWWLALVAAAFGRIYAVPVTTVLYRQHGRNDTGAKRWAPLAAVRRALRDDEKARIRSNLARTYGQAAAFVGAYGERMPPGQRAMAQAYASLPSRDWVHRRVTLLRYGLLKAGILRNVGLLFFS